MHSSNWSLKKTLRWHWISAVATLTAAVLLVDVFMFSVFYTNFFHFHSANVIAAVDSSQWIASSQASCRDCSPPPNTSWQYDSWFVAGCTHTGLMKQDLMNLNWANCVDSWLLIDIAIFCMHAFFWALVAQEWALALTYKRLEFETFCGMRLVPVVHLFFLDLSNK